MTDSKEAEQPQKKNNDEQKGEVSGGSGHSRAPPYVIVFVLLFALTIIEVYISGWDFDKSGMALLLMIIATGKALLVVLYYMHLRYESRILRWIAIIPVAFAIGLVYVMMVV